MIILTEMILMIEMRMIAVKISLMSYPQIKKSGDPIKNSFTKDVNSVICNPIFDKKNSLKNLINIKHQKAVGLSFRFFYKIKKNKKFK